MKMSHLLHNNLLLPNAAAKPRFIIIIIDQNTNFWNLMKSFSQFKVIIFDLCFSRKFYCRTYKMRQVQLVKINLIFKHKAQKLYVIVLRIEKFIMKLYRLFRSYVKILLLRVFRVI